MERDAAAIYLELLVVRCQLGDRQALEELVKHLEPRLGFYLRRLLPTEAEAQQVLQEVWLKVLPGLGKLRDPAKVLPWLYALARNTAMDYLHGLYAQKELQAAEVEEFTGSDGDFAPIDDAEQIYFGLSQVSLADREVLTLFFLEDLSVGELAAILNIPAGTVKSRLFHARRALKEVLEKSGGKPRDE